MNYLTDHQGGEIKPQNPLPVADFDSASERETISAESVTFITGAAGFTSSVALDKKPIANLVGNKTGSFWRRPENLLLASSERTRVTAVTETATAADVTIESPDYDLEELFESPAATLKAVIVLTDPSGGELYGWIGAIAESTATYTIDIYSEAAMAAQTWVGTLGSFAWVAGTRFEIYSNESSFAWVTGTVLTEEIEFPENGSVIGFLDGLTAGQYGIDYGRGTVHYKKATTGTGDTCNYNIIKSYNSVSLEGDLDSLDVEGPDAHDAAITGNPVLQGSEAANFDGSALPNAVGAEGDAVRNKASLSGVPYTMLVSEDGAGTPMVTHDTAIAAATGGDVGLMTMIEAADMDGSALPNAVNAEGDAVRAKASLSGVPFTMLVSEDGSSTPVIDHDTAIGTGLGVATLMMGAEAKNFDGSALPNSVSEGDAVRPAASMNGVGFSMLVNEDGSATPVVAEDAAIAAAVGGSVGLMTMTESRTGQKTAMSASGDATRPVSDEYGQAVGSAFVWSTRKDGVTEANPISTHYLNQSLVDTTNVSAATHYYPSATGGSMDGYKDMSLTGKFIDADGTLTLTLEVTNDEDRLFTDTASVYFYDDELNATVATKTVTNGTELFELSVNNCNFRYYRWVVVASGATNTVILKNRLKAL